ncbi:MAG: iron ABC transporter permease [Chlorobi bacterium]|nr:iron ABC transporter permease [Chlorobiota bacterium]
MKTKTIYTFLLLLFILIGFIILDMVSGSVKIPVSNVINILFHNNSTEWDSIIWKIRIPRIITAILAGMALSVSGLQMQTIFRNPLAGPFVLGISAGASLGVAITVLGFSSILPVYFFGISGNWLIILSAWFGSAIILVIILIVSLRVKDIMTLLIIGIMFGSATSAIVSILQYFSSENLLKSFVIWTMGSLGGVSQSQLNIMSPVIFIGIVMSLSSIKILNISLLGENYTKSMGLNLNFSRIYIFLSTSILTGTITAFCGPVGFIGIAVPHLTRMLFKTTEHSILIPGTIIIGSIIMLASDIFSQLPPSNTTLPLNSVTAIIGVPIVIWVIIRNKKLVSV